MVNEFERTIEEVKAQYPKLSLEGLQPQSPRPRWYPKVIEEVIWAEHLPAFLACQRYLREAEVSKSWATCVCSYALKHRVEERERALNAQVYIANAVLILAAHSLGIPYRVSRSFYADIRITKRSVTRIERDTARRVALFTPKKETNG